MQRTGTKKLKISIKSQEGRRAYGTIHEKVYEGYKNLCKKYPERIKPIDADRSIDEVHSEVIEVIDGLLKGKYYE